MVDKISSLQVFLKKIGANPLKHLSQNFLVDKNIIKKIVASACLTKDDIVLEIGPGPGALTHEIAKYCDDVIAIEMDRAFAKHLSENSENITVYEDDFLKFPLREVLSQKKKKIKVIANLPYHISSPIIAKLLEHHDLFSEITIMIQYEMAKRLTSSKDCKNYSAFTVFINFYAEAKYLFEISPNSFFPKPKVKSAIVQLKPKIPPTDIDNKKFHLFVQKSFQQRRKKLRTTLKNSLKVEVIDLAFAKLNIEENARPENLDYTEFYQLYKLVEKEL